MTGIKLRNSLILTVLAIVGISIIIIFNTSQQEMNQQEMNQQESNENTLPEIEKLLGEIREAKIENEQSEDPYIPTAPSWDNKVGPYIIDRHEYLIGQKIFLDYTSNEAGNLTVIKINNDSKKPDVLVRTIKFNGESNFYFTPTLSDKLGLCNTNDLVGKWVLRPNLSSYPDLVFTVIDKKLPGWEHKFEEIVGIGKC